MVVNQRIGYLERILKLNGILCIDDDTQLFVFAKGNGVYGGGDTIGVISDNTFDKHYGFISEEPYVKSTGIICPT